MKLFSENKDRISALDSEVAQCESTKNYTVRLNDDWTSTVWYYVGVDFFEKTLQDIEALNTFLDEIEGESKKRITKIENKKHSIETENSLIQKISSQKNFSFSISYAHKDLNLDFESSDPAIKKFLNSKSKFLTSNFDESKTIDNVESFIANEVIPSVEFDAPGKSEYIEDNHLLPNESEPTLDWLFNDSPDLGLGINDESISSIDNILWDDIIVNDIAVKDDFFDATTIIEDNNEESPTTDTDIPPSDDIDDGFFDISDSVTNDNIEDSESVDNDNKDNDSFGDDFIWLWESSWLNEVITKTDDEALPVIDDNSGFDDILWIEDSESSNTEPENIEDVIDQENEDKSNNEVDDFLWLGETSSFESEVDETPHNIIWNDIVEETQDVVSIEDDFLGLGTTDTNDESNIFKNEETIINTETQGEVLIEDDFLWIWDTKETDIIEDPLSELTNDDNGNAEDFLWLWESTDSNNSEDPLDGLIPENNNIEDDFLWLGNDTETSINDNEAFENEKQPMVEDDFLWLWDPKIDVEPTISTQSFDVQPIQTPQTVQPIIIQIQQPAVVPQFVSTPVPTTISDVVETNVNTTETKDIIEKKSIEDPLEWLNTSDINDEELSWIDVIDTIKEKAPDIVLPKRNETDIESDKISLDFLAKVKTLKTKIFPNNSFIIKKEGILDKFSGREKILTAVTAFTFIILVVGWIFGSNEISSVKTEYTWKEDSFNQEITTLKTQVKWLEAEKEELIGKKKDAEEKAQPILGSAKNLSLSNIEKIKVDEESDPKMTTSVIKNKYLVVKLPSLKPAAWKKLTIVLNDWQSIDYIIKKSISWTSDWIPQIIDNIEKELSTKPEDQRFFVLVGTDSKQYYIAQP